MFFSSAHWGWVVCLGMHLKYLGWFADGLGLVCVITRRSQNNSLKFDFKKERVPWSSLLGFFSLKKIIEYLITNSHLRLGKHNKVNHLLCACIPLNVYFSLSCFAGINVSSPVRGSEVWILCGHHLQELKNLQKLLCPLPWILGITNAVLLCHYCMSSEILVGHRWKMKVWMTEA